MSNETPRVAVITGASRGIGASLVSAYLESASFVTGEFMHVDGGQSAGH